MADIDGKVEPGWERVREAFAANFDEGRDTGAAVAVYKDGRPVVDLWGGVADSATGRAWNEDTVQLVFSTTKGATATCAHLLAQRGELDLDAPVREYWPEFAAEGKSEVPVRMLLSHRVGLPTVDAALSFEELCAWHPVVEALAAQAPYWVPGTEHGYHAVSYGHLVGEVVRRITGKSLGTFFAEEIATPLGLEWWIGLPESEEPRVAALEQAPFVAPATPPTPERMKIAMAFMDPNGLSMRALTLNGATGGLGGVDTWNSRPMHAAEIPAANGIGTARSIARMYAALVGEVDGVRLLDPRQVGVATEPQSTGPDRVLVGETAFGLGFMLPGPMFPLPDGTFGHYGMGGSVGWANPDRGIAFSYVMNRMGQSIAGDERTNTLYDAVKESLS